MAAQPCVGTVPVLACRGVSTGPGQAVHKGPCVVEEHGAGGLTVRKQE